MIKNIIVAITAVFLVCNIYGCVILAGAAGGAGTAVWLSGKLTQEVNFPFERAVEASKSGIKSLRLGITKVTVEDKVAQIMGKYTDGKTIWVDVHKITEASSRIEVRVGAVSGDKEAAAKILKQIQRHL